MLRHTHGELAKIRKLLEKLPNHCLQAGGAGPTEDHQEAVRRYLRTEEAKELAKQKKLTCPLLTKKCKLGKFNSGMSKAMGLAARDEGYQRISLGSDREAFYMLAEDAASRMG